jgi:hypothetical protein
MLYHVSAQYVPFNTIELFPDPAFDVQSQSLSNMLMRMTYLQMMSSWSDERVVSVTRTTLGCHWCLQKTSARETRPAKKPRFLEPSGTREGLRGEPNIRKRLHCSCEACAFSVVYFVARLLRLCLIRRGGMIRLEALVELISLNRCKHFSMNIYSGNWVTSATTSFVLASSESCQKWVGRRVFRPRRSEV